MVVTFYNYIRDGTKLLKIVFDSLQNSISPTLYVWVGNETFLPHHLDKILIIKHSMNILQDFRKSKQTVAHVISYNIWVLYRITYGCCHM